MSVKILAVSDQVDPRIHSASLKERMGDVTLVIGCGDVPARYLEFLADALDRPVYFVLGNHLEELTRKGQMGRAYEPMGCVDLGGKVVRDSWTGLVMAGFPGSPRYCDGEEQQYTEFELRMMMLRMAPRLLWNRIKHGRALDLLVTHAPPRDVNDRMDPPHRGFRALRTFLRWFKPTYHLHGHIHIYDRNEQTISRFEQTDVVNVYPFRTLELETAANGAIVQPHGGQPVHWQHSH